MDIRSTIIGDAEAMMRQARADLAIALRRGVTEATDAVHEEIRAQLVGSLPAEGINSLFGVRIFPTGGSALQNSTLAPAGFIYPKKPKMVLALVDPQEIVARHGRSPVFPTPNNQDAHGNPRVSIGDMVRARGRTFLIVPKSNPAVRLWCLRGGDAVDFGTLRRDEMAWRMSKQLFPGERRPFVPTFILTDAVHPGKRIDIEAVRQAAGPILGDRITAALADEAKP